MASYKGPVALRDLRVHLGKEESLAQLGSRGHRVIRVCRVPLDRRALLALRAQLVRTARQERRAILVNRGRRGSLERMEPRGQKETRLPIPISLQSSWKD